MARILVTGATGFVGQTLCPALRREGHLLTGTTRNRYLRAGPGNIPLNVIDDIGPDTDWSRALAGAEFVIHLAGRAHVMNDCHDDSAAEFHRINVDGTRHLADEAVKAGVRRFIFLSSIKVNGEQTEGAPYRETDEPHPEDAYGISKRDAELALCDVALDTAMETVIIRPPLIYGPNVKGNLLSLLHACAKGRILPLGGINNRRSLVSAENLSSAIALCVTHPAAAGEIFLVRDGDDLSTSDLFSRTALALGTKARLITVPPWLLRLAGKVAGRTAAINRLTGSLVIDDSHIRETLDWSAPISVDHGLTEMAAAYMKSQEN